MNDKKITQDNALVKDGGSKPDEETLNKTDPQDNMKGPLSSLMQDTGEAFETDETKAETDKEKDENM